ncbi:GroES-like protein, partial [Caulochytrium protostelioides]
MTTTTLPATMKAIQQSELGGVDVLKLRDLPLPTIADDQVLVQNAYTGINFIDTYFRTGLYKLPLPFVPGREAAGRVVQVGARVTAFRPGDRVVYMHTDTYAEYTAASTETMQVVPAGVSLRDAVAPYLQGLTAVALVRFATFNVAAGQTALVTAAAGG